MDDALLLMMKNLKDNFMSEYNQTNFSLEKTLKNLTSPIGSEIKLETKTLDIGQEIGFAMLATLGQKGGLSKLFDEIFANLGKAFSDGVKGTADSPFQMLIDYDKAIRDATASLGLTNHEAEMLSENFKESAFELAKFNFSQKDIYESQGVFNKELRSTRQLLTDEMGLIAKISKGVNFDKADVLISNLVKYGTNFKSINNAVEETLFKSNKLGINTANVLESALGSVKEAQKVNFKDGVNGLIDMARQSEMLKANMGDTFGMINKARNLEGAVELSTKLQMLGKNVDALKLNFLARNDPKEFQQYMNTTLKSIGTLKRATGEVEFDAIDYDILQAMSDYTGQSVENMKEQIVMQKRISQAKMMNLKLTDDEAIKVANIARVEDGILKVMTKGGLKSVKDLTSEEIKSLDAIKIPLEERAKNVQGSQEIFEVAMRTASASLLEFSDDLTKKINAYKAFSEELTSGLSKKDAGMAMATFGSGYKLAMDRQKEMSKSKLGLSAMMGIELTDGEVTSYLGGKLDGIKDGIFGIGTSISDLVSSIPDFEMPDFGAMTENMGKSLSEGAGEIGETVSKTLNDGIDKLIMELVKNKVFGTTNLFESTMSKSEMRRMMNEIMSDDSKGG